MHIEIFQAIWDENKSILVFGDSPSQGYFASTNLYIWV